MNANEMLGTGDIANMLGLSQKWVTDRITKNVSFPKPAINLSRRIRKWRRQDVETWLKKQH